MRKRRRSAGERRQQGIEPCGLYHCRGCRGVTLERLPPSMAVTREKSQLMSASEIDRTLVRLAHEILERTKDLDRLVFIGIRRRGVPLAQRLAKKIDSLERRQVPVGILDINLYRDDLSTVSTKP